MGRISIDLVKPGMILAAPVKDFEGRLLLNGGTLLTERHMRVFKLWGVSEADIENLDAAEVEAKEISLIDPALFEQARVEMEELFRHAMHTDPAMAELFRVSVLRRARSLTNEHRHGD